MSDSGESAQSRTEVTNTLVPKFARSAAGFKPRRMEPTACQALLQGQELILEGAEVKSCATPDASKPTACDPVMRCKHPRLLHPAWIGADAPGA